MILEIKNKTELDDFNYALEKAYVASCDFVQHEDGGTCNFDTCIVKVKISKRLRELTSFRLLKVHDTKIYKGYWMIDFPVFGQGNRRTKMAEVACSILRNLGYESQVWYQAD